MNSVRCFSNERWGGILRLVYKTCGDIGPASASGPIGVWPGKEASWVIRVRDFRSPVIATLRVAQISPPFGVWAPPLRRSEDCWWTSTQRIRQVWDRLAYSVFFPCKWIVNGGIGARDSVALRGYNLGAWRIQCQFLVECGSSSFDQRSGTR